eukprot:scaffold219868_cov14-Tisochrysis_lutea.AAC.1
MKAVFRLANQLWVPGGRTCSSTRAQLVLPMGSGSELMDFSFLPSLSKYLLFDSYFFILLVDAARRAPQFGALSSPGMLASSHEEDAAE